MRAEATTRRAVLITALSGSVLAGCKGIAALGPLPQVNTEVVTLEHAISDEELMIARCEAAVSALAGDAHAAAVSGILADHRSHLAALKSRLILPPRLATARPRPSPTPSSLPSGRRAMLAALAAAERAASTRLATQLLTVPAPLAQLMSSIGASEASHVVVLSVTRA